MATSSGSYDVREYAGEALYDHLVQVGSPEIWWQVEGPFAGLHLLNQVRVPYFERVLGGYAGKRILDVGCGGGVFAEAIARAGARVIGIDPSVRTIEAAREHADAQGLDIDYRVARAEEFETHEHFDAVMTVDVLEHVDDLDATLDACARLLDPGAPLGFLTHSQTLEAFDALIWRAEYLEGRIPKGLHDFHKFVNPDDLTERLETRGMQVVEIRGVEFNHRLHRSAFVDMPDVSYIGYAVKR